MLLCRARDEHPAHSPTPAPSPMQPKQHHPSSCACTGGDPVLSTIPCVHSGDPREPSTVYIPVRAQWRPPGVYIPCPLWLTSLAAMTLLMTVWRKSFSPATLGEKRDDMFSGLCRMASSNASLEGTGRATPQETKGYGDPWVTVTGGGTREHRHRVRASS